MSAVRKYWVQYRYRLPSETVHVYGETGVQREMPICGPDDVTQMAVAIGQTLLKAGTIVPMTDLNVIAWTKFEEPSILLPTRPE